MIGFLVGVVAATSAVGIGMIFYPEIKAKVSAWVRSFNNTGEQ